MGFGVAENFYPDQGLSDFEHLSNVQASESLGYGDQAANYADPFMDERGRYQNQLRKLMSNPGSFSKSPAYKFAFNQGMNALNAKGSVRSGNKLAELMKYGQGMASQLYGQQAQLLSNLAMSGSSPAAAGLAYSRGTERSQDYRQMGAAAGAAGGGKPTGGAPGAALPPWMQTGPLLPPRSDPYRDQYYGGGGGGGGSYSPGQWAGAGGPTNSWNAASDPYLRGVMDQYFPNGVGGGGGGSSSPAPYGAGSFEEIDTTSWETGGDL